MSTTTQILFNSPALHSLKREQLVKLCKIHSLKANGKNVEIIARLKQHAQNLPKDSPLSIAARSEEHGDEGSAGEEAMQQGSSGSGSGYNNMPRPSEQWEVMESIQEVEESSSQGTISSLRTLGNGNNGASEFGTGGSKSSTVSSSIKALASSLGLKRSTTKSTIASSSSTASIPPVPIRPPVNDELTQNSTPYSALPPSTSLPQTDHFTFNPTHMSISSLAEPDIPLPGHVLRPGLPAPENARLSMGLGLGAPSTPARKQPTTTIRLISNPFTAAANESSYGSGECGTPQLKPFETDFDLILGSPASRRPGSIGFGFSNLSSWPPHDKEDEGMKGIYPTLTTNDLPPTMTPGTAIRTQPQPVTEYNADEDVDMPGSLAATTSPTTGSALKAPVEPFIFGSPLPQHNVSNNQFRTAAASVLEEMNKRLREEGVDGVDLSLVNNLHAGAHSQADLERASRAMKSLPGIKGDEIKQKFEKMHQQEFSKMEGIDEFLKRRSPGKKGDKDDEKVVVGKKRKSSVLGNGAGRDAHGRRIPGAAVGRASTTRVISNGRRGRVIPGSFGDDTDEEEIDEREEKRVRAEETAGTPASALDEEAKRKKEEEEEEERQQKEKEREAIKRRLEMNKARRKSSVAAGGLQGRKSGRVSVGRGGVLVKPKPKPSRFGFLSSAKSMVQNVWNRGKTTAPAPPSSIPKPAAPSTKIASTSVLKKPHIAPARPSASAVASSSSRVSSLRVGREKDQDAGKGSVASSSRSRSPIPSFGTSSTRNSGMLGAAGTRASRNSSIAGSSRTGAVTGSTSRNSSIAGTGVSRGASAGVSSIGTRLSSARVPPAGNVGSMGSKKVLGPPGRASTTGSTSSTSRLSTSSRLLAPTASSLAKMHRPSMLGSKAAAEHHNAGSSTAKSDALEPITNNPAIKIQGPFSPGSGKIFSTPLQFASGIPTPVKKRSTAPSSSEDVSAEIPQNSQGPSSITGVTRQKTLAGRKPRISRSKVIARLASQRAAGTSGSSSGAGVVTPRASHGGRTRSSMGAKVQRASFAGGKRSSAGGDILMSAKKRARQSEYARRRSRVGPIDAMDVDKADE